MRVEQEMLARRREESRKNEGGKAETSPPSSTEGAARETGVRKLESRPGENIVRNSGSDESGGRTVVRQRVRGKNKPETGRHYFNKLSTTFVQP